MLDATCPDVAAPPTAPPALAALRARIAAARAGGARVALVPFVERLGSGAPARLRLGRRVADRVVAVLIGCGTLPPHLAHAVGEGLVMVDPALLHPSAPCPGPDAATTEAMLLVALAVQTLPDALVLPSGSAAPVVAARLAALGLPVAALAAPR